MSYQVLARKYRPKNFTQVVGQEHILRALINALTQNRLHHAYLFTGTRGVGKTTIARILAKCFNCETGITALPCGQCDACKEIDAGRFIDLIEVDAASRTKVEDTRDLLDNVQYLPAKGRFKIYIIDEVHMLSGHSFNALLKTLEEPPEHVKFLLATTDPQKLPITVLSRCLQFNLKAVNPEIIQKQLKLILEQESIQFEPQALHSLALAANGSVRDALSLLDQAIAFSQSNITTEDINAMLGNIDANKIFALLQALAGNDARQILLVIEQLANLAVDFIGVLNNLLEILQHVAIIQLVAEADTSNWQQADLIKSLAAQFNQEDVQLYYQIGLIGKRDLLLAPTMRMGFEMLMLRMLAFRPVVATDFSLRKTANSLAANPVAADFSLRKISGQDSGGQINNKQTATSSNLHKKPEQDNNIQTYTNPIDAVLVAAGSCSCQESLNNDNCSSKNILDCFANGARNDEIMQVGQTGINSAEILQKLQVSGPTQALLQHCVITNIDQDKVAISLDAKHSLWLNKRQEETISQALSKYLERPVMAIITLETPRAETPAVMQKRETEHKKQQASQAILQDLNIEALINKFDAKIISDPINIEN